MRNARFQHQPPKGNLFSALLVLLVLAPAPPSHSSLSDSFSMAGLVVAQTKDTFAIGRDGQTSDRMIMISSPVPGFEDSTMIIGRDQDTGDRIIYVAPPPEQPKRQDVLLGPLVIIPEITWPGVIWPDPRRWEKGK